MATYGLDKYSTTATYNSVWRSEVFNVNQSFKVKRLTIPLANDVDSTTTVTIRALLDDNTTAVTLTTINNTNYPGKRRILYKAGDLASVQGDHNLIWEIKWTGTTEMPVLLPIVFEIDINEEN